MRIDVRTRQAGTLFSLGLEEDPPAWARPRPRFDLPWRIWTGMNAILALRARPLPISQAPGAIKAR